MSDIARLAGVSEATVSRALNDSPLVRAETKVMIRTIAEAHDYRVDATARNLRLQRTNTIAFLIASEPGARRRASDPFLLELLGAAADAVSTKGYDLLLVQEAAESRNLRQRILDLRRSDGVIIAGQGERHADLNLLADSGVSFVVWGAQLPDQRYVTIGGDNHEGGRLAAAHLLALGRRKLAFLGDLRQPEEALRHAGFVRAHADAGLTCDPILTLPNAAAGQDNHNVLSRELAARPGLDALVASSDVLAFSAMAALAQAGRAVPGDVAVTGYDDIGLAGFSAPPLTTLRQNMTRGGAALVSALTDMLDGKRVESQVLETELVVRASCGASRPS